MSMFVLGTVAAFGLVLLYKIYKSTRPDRVEEAHAAFLEGAAMGFDARRTARELALINQASDASAAYRDGVAMGRGAHENNGRMVHEAYREGVDQGCEVFKMGVATGFAMANENNSVMTSSTSSRRTGSSRDVRLRTSTSLLPAHDGSGRSTHRRRTVSRNDSRRRGYDSSYGSDDNLPRRNDSVVVNGRHRDISSEDSDANLPRRNDSVVVNDRRRDISSEDSIGNLPRINDSVVVNDRSRNISSENSAGYCGSGYSELQARERRHNRI